MKSGNYSLMCVLLYWLLVFRSTVVRLVWTSTSSMWLAVVLVLTSFFFFCLAGVICFFLRSPVFLNFSLKKHFAKNVCNAPRIFGCFDYFRNAFCNLVHKQIFWCGLCLTVVCAGFPMQLDNFLSNLANRYAQIVVWCQQMLFSAKKFYLVTSCFQGKSWSRWFRICKAQRRPKEWKSEAEWTRQQQFFAYITYWPQFGHLLLFAIVNTRRSAKCGFVVAVVTCYKVDVLLIFYC